MHPFTDIIQRELKSTFSKGKTDDIIDSLLLLTTSDSTINSDITLIASQQNILKDKIVRNLLSQDNANLEQSRINNNVLTLIDKLQEVDIEVDEYISKVISHSKINFLPSLKIKLEQEYQKCKLQNVMLYTPNLFLVLINSEDSICSQILNNYQERLQNRLKFIFMDFVEKQLHENIGNEFEEFEWTERKDIKRAAFIANSDAVLVSEKHILAGILIGDSTTNKMLNEKMGINTNELIRILLLNLNNSNFSDKTPTYF